MVKINIIISNTSFLIRNGMFEIWLVDFFHQKWNVWNLTCWFFPSEMECLKFDLLIFSTTGIMSQKVNQLPNMFLTENEMFKTYAWCFRTKTKHMEPKSWPTFHKHVTTGFGGPKSGWPCLSSHCWPAASVAQDHVLLYFLRSMLNPTKNVCPEPTQHWFQLHTSWACCIMFEIRRWK